VTGGPERQLRRSDIYCLSFLAFLFVGVIGTFAGANYGILAPVSVATMYMSYNNTRRRSLRIAVGGLVMGGIGLQVLQQLSILGGSWHVTLMLVQLVHTLIFSHSLSMAFSICIHIISRHPTRAQNYEPRRTGWMLASQIICVILSLFANLCSLIGAFLSAGESTEPSFFTSTHAGWGFTGAGVIANWEEVYDGIKFLWEIGGRGCRWAGACAVAGYHYVVQGLRIMEKYVQELWAESAEYRESVRGLAETCLQSLRRATRSSSRGRRGIPSDEFIELRLHGEESQFTLDEGGDLELGGIADEEILVNRSATATTLEGFVRTSVAYDGEEERVPECEL
jgi:hypothetical protein